MNIVERFSRYPQQDSSAEWYRLFRDAAEPDETEVVRALQACFRPAEDITRRTSVRATELITRVRADSGFAHAVDKLLQEYSLSSEEGIILMCLAEALMRIPDPDTADSLIRDKFSRADWDRHLGQSGSMLVNAATWGLLLTGKVTRLDQVEASAGGLFGRLVNRASEPVIRLAMQQAMKIMGSQFVLGQTMPDAIARGRAYKARGYSYSFDMLGEAAMTDEDAERYYEAYVNAIHQVGSATDTEDSVSIKLTALHPRFEASHAPLVMNELGSRLLELVRLAKSSDVALTIDAEEAARTELMLSLFTHCYTHPEIRGWGKFGLVLQCYQKRCFALAGYLESLARETGDTIPVRLVKGAYWDAEIKHAQVHGYHDYPVFTRKENTDAAYLACAERLLKSSVDGHIFPQFASHNAHAVAAVIEMAAATEGAQYEFQRLHGMGDSLYDAALDLQPHLRVRIYAPVGAHKDLLPYLVRRLLENGANSSFVHRLVDARTPVAALVQSPFDAIAGRQDYRNAAIPLPADLFCERKNSIGLNLDYTVSQEHFMLSFKEHCSRILAGDHGISTGLSGELRPVVQPAHPEMPFAEVRWASDQDVSSALAEASAAWWEWHRWPVESRATCLERLAELLEASRPELIALCVLEAGKTLPDAVDEIREAVDFCRYYAAQARQNFGPPLTLPGPTGEVNDYYLEGRGVFVCI
ncbi:MAG: bifunctional proline dehydrogenase/L-glutamate gamma-semialdehyde dehydrogenase PutA, partial [Pseudomonadales bacterium]|nr:bifunctional proline dehydrogenase/L-glutamate gamma-semialdehyde dehydrogenase PutA [Pseudomonadales bacterium]